MAAWWPDEVWQPWADLLAAGVRVVDDPRNVSPPCALVEIQDAAAVGGCAVDYTVVVTLIAPGPDHKDARRWLWQTGAEPLLSYATSISAGEWNDYPAAIATIVEGGQQWP